MNICAAACAVPQLFSQVNVGDAAKRLGIGNTTFQGGPQTVVDSHPAYQLCVSVAAVPLQLFSQVNVGDAAKQLGIGKTKFKAICRSFGISRWPYR
jgi:hypothetical protein